MQQKEKTMAVTRRELCSILPAVLIPAILPTEAIAEQDKPMPSAMFPFDKLPIRTPNNAQIREVLKGKLATGESLEVHETTLPPGGAPPCGAPSRALRNVADSRRDSRTDGERHELPPWTGFGRIRAFERRTRNQERRYNVGHLFCRGRRPRRGVRREETASWKKSGRPPRKGAPTLPLGCGGQKKSFSASWPMRGSPACPARKVPKAPALSFWKFVMLG